MSVDPPARIVVIGAGPIGLEAALYARYLGYEVTLLEAGRVCESVQRWGHVRMFTPFSMNSSSLGLAALKAQDPDFVPPEPDHFPTGAEWFEGYLEPLANSDLLVDAIHTNCEVVTIERLRFLKHELPGDAQRGEDQFRVEYIDYSEIDDKEFVDAQTDLAAAVKSITAKVVLDCSGTFAQPNEAWSGWTSSLELEQPRLSYHIPSGDNAADSPYAGKRTLVIGSGYSAATSVANLAALANEASGTEVVWLTRRTGSDAGPITRIEQDRLPQRDALASGVNQLALAEDSPVEWVSAARVVSIEETGSDDRLRVHYQTAPSMPEVELEEGEELVDEDDEQAFEAHEIVVDRVVVNVGYRPNIQMFRELQVHLCFASEGPMKLAAAILSQSGQSADCLDQQSPGAETLKTTEPNFYLLGAKSYGRNSNFLYSVGLDQVREVFTLVGGRETLDLYESVRNLA